MDAVISAAGLTKTYHMGEVVVHALRGVDLELSEGEFVVLLGASGSGKSTLLNILGGLDTPTAGTVHYRGEDLSRYTDPTDALSPGARRFHLPVLQPPEHRAAILNDLHLRAGRWVERGRGEALVSEAFAAAHGLALGDEVSAVLNGKYQQFRLVGVALSPEYIFQMQGGSLFPDDKRFGVLWVGYEELAASFDMEEAFNHIAAALMPGATEDEVIRRIDLLTEPYGGLGAHGRNQQISHRFVSEEIQQLRAMAMISPSIFLGVAVFLLNVVLNRMVSAQREQIAALKAFGYSRREVALHFLKFGVVIMVVGSLLGIAAGQWLGKLMTGLYGQFYRFPYIDYRMRPSVVMLALLISGAAGTLAVVQAVAKAASLPPRRSDATRASRHLSPDASRTSRFGSPVDARRPHDDPPARAPSDQGTHVGHRDRHGDCCARRRELW